MSEGTVLIPLVRMIVRDMTTDLLEMMVVNAPNFLGLAVAAGIQYRIIIRLLDKLDKCDCDPVDKDDGT